MRTSLFILIALLGGFSGAYLFSQVPKIPLLGANVARTTITNPWTFATGTTMSKTVTVTTTNTATSTVKTGCLQLTATTTAQPIKLVITSVATTAPTYAGSVTGLAVIAAYGSCPNL